MRSLSSCPLDICWVETALEWARESGEVSATLAICRGFDHEGAVFVWGFHLQVLKSARQIFGHFAERAFLYRD